jgi:transposase-like protein
MRILAFNSEFPTEQVCRDHFKKAREKAGIKCKNFGGQKHYWLPSKNQWQCANCKFRTTLRSGTVMENSKLSFLIWYQAAAFMSFSKKGISAKELQRQLNHKRYDTIWSLMHRIRLAMGNRDNKYTLEGMIEFDEAFYEKATPEGIKLKRGKGSQKQQNLAVMAESTYLEDIETGKVSKHCRYFKMKVLDNHKSDAIQQTVKTNIDEQSIVFSDKCKTYLELEKYVDTHITEKSSKRTINKTLKWVHIAISNSKRTLLGIYHKIKGKYLQLYLDEFCFKVNRRYFGENLFYRTINAMADALVVN